MKLFSDSVFNQSVYLENVANRWKFLEHSVSSKDDLGFLLNSPTIIFTLTGLYIMFVCYLGPLVMRNREPFQLKTTIRFYNLLMIIMAAYLVIKVHDAIESFGSFFNCNTTFNFNDQSATKVYQIGSLILLVRLSEYLDTIFFILRKKFNQVSFLHVFHHAIVPIYAFWILRTGPLRFNVFIVYINSMIHVLMYFYYFLATFQEPRDSSKKKQNPGLVMYVVNKFLMFKKYMTQMQILQFVCLIFYTIWASLQNNHCRVPWTYIASNFILAITFLGLFLHFYLKIYKAASSNRSKRD